MSLTSYRTAPSRVTDGLAGQRFGGFSLRKADWPSRLIGAEAKVPDGTAGA